MRYFDGILQSQPFVAGEAFTMADITVIGGLIFAGKLLGVDVAFNDLTLAQKGQIAAIAAGFTGLLSLFNIGGRFVWASCSDFLGRKVTYGVFFVLGF